MSQLLRISFFNFIFFLIKTIFLFLTFNYGYHDHKPLDCGHQDHQSLNYNYNLEAAKMTFLIKL